MIKALIKISFCLLFLLPINGLFGQCKPIEKNISIKKRERLQRKCERKKIRKEKKARRQLSKRHRKMQSKAVRKRMKKNKRRDRKRKNH
jgi:hypothetical protein